MIPDHLIDKAVHAAGENWALTFEWEHDKLHAQVHAALEAVAAEIWQDGYDFGVHDEFTSQDWTGGEVQPNRKNPYKASED